MYSIGKYVYVHSNNSNCLDGSVKYLPNNLRWFVWNNYPCKSLPKKFEPKRLVHLDLSLSSLCHLWMENKHLPFLQKLDLRDSRSLMQTPDFTWMPNLKYLDLSYCRNLESVHYSLGYSKELIELNLYNCGRLKRFPCVNVESLIYMDLGFCSSLEKFPKIFGTMKPELKFKTGLSGIKELPSSIKDEPELETLLQMREKNVVGIDAHLEKVKSLLEMESGGVLIMGIWGFGGVGKTTIARAIFDTLSYQFEAVCFLADIKETKCGMHSLQNILLSELLKEKANYVNNKEHGRSLLAHRLRSKKVLVVLDDIDHKDQLDYLAGNLNWFGNGSRIIATTRYKHLIGKNTVYEVPMLHEHDAVQLFEQYAFKGEVSCECFKELTLEVVRRARGLPLALRLFGSFFYKRDITEWRSAINQIKNNSESEIVEILKISYDGLETIQQDIFLDIACFLRGRRKDYVMQILESCYFGADIGLSVLIDKSLVSISGNNTIEMHDLIQDMGKYVVKKQKDPGERSRLWLTEDFEELMINNMGTKAVEAIWVPNFNKPCFSKEAMETMQRLRILCIHDSNCLDGSVEYLPNNLRWFVWNNYPCESLPENFEPQKLVHLDLSLSSLRHLWTETKGSWE